LQSGCFYGNIEKMTKYQIDETMIQVLIRDRDYLPADLEEYFVYFQKSSNSLIYFENDDEDDDEDDDNSFSFREKLINRKIREDIERNPSNYIEIPLPSHGVIHQWFRQWLTSIGREKEYFGSIGGWLKTYAEDSDQNEWSDYEWKCKEKYVLAILEKAGVQAEII